MGNLTASVVVVAAIVMLSILQQTHGIRFVIDREECFSHNVEYEGDTVHVSFVVIRADAPWHYGDDGVDLVVLLKSTKPEGSLPYRVLKITTFVSEDLNQNSGMLSSDRSFIRSDCSGFGFDLVRDWQIKGPGGEQIHDFRDKTSEKYEFVVHKKGLHRFCFTNKSPYHETIDFDVHVGHFAYYDQHAKDEHFTPLMEQISKLEEALYNIQFEQHWLEAQTDRQAIVNEGMSKRAIHKALFESFAHWCKLPTSIYT